MPSSHNQLTTNDRVKFDSELLLKYVYDFKMNDSKEPNIIKVCKVKVKRSCGAILAHYYAKVYVSNNFAFEFHPGSQPKTFQNIDSTDGTPIKVLIMCDECCKKELASYIEGENRFNIAFQNCETILCKRKSVQTVLGIAIVVVLLSNMINFEFFFIVLISFLIVLMYFINNYMIKQPTVEMCPHYVNKS
ncbi:hypothetical protein SlGVgp094 [Spodoptera litura granulovirus]|uniref:Ac81 n=1 Tax=Spodoptera litura granulovirus TaxID=359919 RepID=A5IZU6_9BBAC|nr:hypothetical protein SlGVgp094 [Spodoptera litura granulovirus]ABQ52037.1 hypothetical protein SlGVgp094 [Spodoptera litura granulovirus]